MIIVDGDAGRVVLSPSENDWAAYRAALATAATRAAEESKAAMKPAETADGRTNLFGALKRTMAKTGYRDLKEFQRVDLVLGGRSD